MDLRDPATVAIEFVGIKGEFALLSNQVSTGLQNLTSQIAGIQSEFRDHGRMLRAVESAQQEMQSHSQGLERLAQSIADNTAENRDWRKTHENENRLVSDRVTTFKGIMIGVTMLSATVFVVATYWINAEFSNIRREQADEKAALAEKRGAILANHERDIGEIRAQITELKARGAIQ